MAEFNHAPVLLNECIEMLNIKPNGIYIDGTLGGAGHSSHILKNLGKDGILIGLDQDIDAIKAASERLEKVKNDSKSEAEYAVVMDRRVLTFQNFSKPMSAAKPDSVTW